MYSVWCCDVGLRGWSSAPTAGGGLWQDEFRSGVGAGEILDAGWSGGSRMVMLGGWLYGEHVVAVVALSLAVQTARDGACDSGVVATSLVAASWS